MLSCSVAYLCQCPMFHHVLQGPTLGASAAETQMVPAVAYKDNQLESKNGLTGAKRWPGRFQFNLLRLLG